MRFDAIKAIYDLNHRRSDWEIRQEQHGLDEDEPEPIGLSPTDTAILAYLARRANDESALVWASIDTMCAATRYSNKTVRRSLKSNIDKGTIEIVRKGRGPQTDTYRVLIGIAGDASVFNVVAGAGSGPVTVTGLAPVENLTIAVTASVRPVDESLQSGRSDLQYKKEATNKARVPLPRTVRINVQDLSLLKPELDRWYLTSAPRDRAALSELARTLIESHGERNVGSMNEFQIRAIAKKFVIHKSKYEG